MMRKFLLLLTMTMAVAFTAFGRGSTTSSIRGRVTDAAGEALPGATIIALHKPTGVEYGNVADLEGYFRISNVPVGGPYTITISYVGFESDVKENVYLSLGQTYSVNSKLSDTAVELEAVLVTAGRGEIIDGNRTGAETNISLEEINATPTVSRSIGDFARFTPQAKIEEGNDGLEISIGGFNNRYNAIYIDGAVNNDVFGLAASGTNGGQTGVSPISIDAIEQFTVSIAPFDVRQSGFAGGSISAVTRSGTNEFEGSAYYLFRNEDLAGKTPFENENEEGLEREKLSDFAAETYGVRLGGPIIKNKVFFFASAEFQRDETPQPFDFENNYAGDASLADINNLINHVRDTYGYDMGDFRENTAFLNSDKLLGKIDWNINQNHKLTVRHAYTRAENLEARNSTSSGLSFVNGSEYFNSTTNSSAIELRSLFGNNLSNQLTIGSTFVRDDRDPLGDPFPAMFIDDGRGGITFGAETFSTANLLNQDIITINDNLEIYKGKHTFIAGLNFEFYQTRNLFIANNFGSYSWSRSDGRRADLGLPAGGNNIQDFINGVNPSAYFLNFSLRDDVVGDESLAGVEFNGALYGFYLQDEYQANNKLKLTLGLRFDVQTFDDTPENSDFNNRSIPLIEAAGYDLQGARTGEFIKPQLYIAPRFGFNYDVNGDNTLQLRGGVGLFTSRIPLVWPGGAYNNNGINQGGFRSFDDGRNGIINDVPFNPDVNTQRPSSIDLSNPTPSGNIDLFAEDFKIPQVLKANLAADKKLGWGMIGTVEVLYSAFINDVYYQNVNVKPATEFLAGSPDDRPIFNFDDDPVDPTYNRVILGSNISKGYNYNLTASLTKPFDNGFLGSVSYSYGDAQTVYDGTSSQNSSQWRGLHAIDGRNFYNHLARSDFAQGHRILAQVSYRKEYGGFGATQIGLVYEGQSGNLYSYLYRDGDELTLEDSRNRALIYVPNDASEINLVDYTDGGGNIVTAEQQWNDLNDFIAQDDYLRERRGQYAERNQNRTPFENILDLRLLQDFYIQKDNGKKNTLQFSLDIFNFTNMLNSKWGKRYNRQFGGYNLIDFEGFRDGTTVPEFTYRGIENNEVYFGNLDDRGTLSSRWQVQIGLRYIFGG